MRKPWWIGIVALGVSTIAPIVWADAPHQEDTSAPLADASCGKPGLPDCPLQSWMKANIVAPKSAGNSELLAKNLTRIGGLAPNGSGWAADWKTISDAGAIASRKGDKDGVNASCTSCHAKYRKTYREKYRENPVAN